MLMHGLASWAMSNLATATPLAAMDNGTYIVFTVITVVVALILIGFIAKLGLGVLGVRFIPNDRVGIIEKLWSGKGSVSEGRILAFNGEAGFEAKVLRGGIHFWLWSLQYRIHKVPLVTIPQGKVGYVYSRDG